MSSLSPVPVWKVTLVTTLITESGLESVDEISVPVQEVTSLVNGHGLVDMGGDEVIISRPCAVGGRKGCDLFR